MITSISYASEDGAREAVIERECGTDACEVYAPWRVEYYGYKPNDVDGVTTHHHTMTAAQAIARHFIQTGKVSE